MLKNIGFFEIYSVSAVTDKGEDIEPVRTRGGGRVNFSRFCSDVLYGRPLAFLGRRKQAWK